MTDRRGAEDLAVANHESWFVAQAVAGGGRVVEHRGVRFTVEGGDRPRAAVMFPTLDGGDGREVLDEVTARLRGVPVGGVGVWSRAPARPPELGAWMLARGYGWGWQPHWMVLDLATVGDAPCPAGVRIDEPAGAVEADVDDVPYYSPAGGRLAGQLAAVTPRAAWTVTATAGGRFAGWATVHVAAGDPPHAGLYNMGVAGGLQRRGIGTAIVRAAARRAAALGCRWMTLNSTHAGRALYRGAGFTSVGDGQTWWMHAAAVADPPSPGEVAFVEAVATGDLTALDGLAPGGVPADLDRRFPNGHTAIETAVVMGRPASVGWLEDHGASLEILSAWDLGWRDRMAEMIRRQPHLADHPVDDGGVRPLHVAVQRNDPALVAALLAAGADPTLRDDTYHSDALGWARYLGSDACATVLESHGRATS